MADSKYSEYLKDIKWRTKRKRILLRDGNKCTACSSKVGLVVHHTFYYTDYREPWRYPDSSLITLCENCHNKYHREHENESKQPPEFKSNKKIKVIKKHKNKKQFKGKREKRPSLLSMQSKRLGYVSDGLGHWIKDSQSVKQ